MLPGESSTFDCRLSVPLSLSFSSTSKRRWMRWDRGESTKYSCPLICSTSTCSELDFKPSPWELAQGYLTAQAWPRRLKRSSFQYIAWRCENRIQPGKASHWLFIAVSCKPCCLSFRLLACILYYPQIGCHQWRILFARGAQIFCRIAFLVQVRYKGDSAKAESVYDGIIPLTAAGPPTLLALQCLISAKGEPACNCLWRLSSSIKRAISWLWKVLAWSLTYRALLHSFSRTRLTSSVVAVADCADAVVYALTRPAHVQIGEQPLPMMPPKTDQIDQYSWPYRSLYCTLCGVQVPVLPYLGLFRCIHVLDLIRFSFLLISLASQGQAFERNCPEASSASLDIIIVTKMIRWQTWSQLDTDYTR